MAKWILKQEIEDQEFADLTVHPLVLKLLCSRGLQDREEIVKFLAPNYETDSFDPFLFADMEKAVERISQARDKKETVAIFGDYDADGITSSAILKETLDELGVESFVYIPNKQTEGYGMSMAALEIIKEKGATLIITVDCGITNIAEVVRAKELGLEVIITDHHHVPQEKPAAVAILNPNDPASQYPFRDLAGVGMAFKLVQAVFQKLMSEKIEQTKWMLDLVAIGTIADCVSLTGENRLFVKYGLLVLSKTRRTGLLEMFKVGSIVISEKVAPDTKKVSFYIAPRINAAGRINHANLAYDLLMEKEVVAARDLALELEASNTQRQKITEELTAEVKLIAERDYKDKKFIFAVGEHFPIGVVGLVAGKIAQKFNKPCAIFQKEEGISKGSFRSIPQLNMIETLGQCPELLVKFGGHSQAAGASVRNEDLAKFEQKMQELIESQLAGVELVPEFQIDSELEVKEIGFNLAEELEKLKPFGVGNEEPIFKISNLVVQEKRNLGSGEKHLKFFLAPAEGEFKLLEAVSFNGFAAFGHFQENDKLDIICNVQKDEWNGNQKIQLILLDAKFSEK